MGANDENGGSLKRQDDPSISDYLVIVNKLSYQNLYKNEIHLSKETEKGGWTSFFFF